MQVLITFMAVVAGLVFSVAVALVVEELIFGQVFRIFFTPQRAEVKSASNADGPLRRRGETGEMGAGAVSV
jgi:hypothetical protein